jgi:endonuclease/exonuclease/phosphatase family metal-dependent hydrolase
MFNIKYTEEFIELTEIMVLKKNTHSMIGQSDSTQEMTSQMSAQIKKPHQTGLTQLKIVSFNIWDLPYWFVKNRKQRILQIAEYLLRLDAEIVCLQESFDVHHRRLLHEHLGCDRYYASGGFEATRKAPLSVLDTTGGLVIFSKFPIIQDTFMPFNQFTPSLVERIGRKGVLEATIETPYGIMQVFNIHLHKGQKFFAHSIRVKQLKSIIERMRAQRYWPIILAGDFNENALMEQKKFFTMLQSRGLTHFVAFESYDRMPSYRLNNPLVNNWIDPVKCSCRLDYILVGLTENFNFKVVQHEPLYLNPSLSDHDPVFLSLTSEY